MKKEKKDLLKNKNILSILEIIRKSEGISRIELAKNTSQTPASITKITKKLLDSEFILDVGLLSSTGGRPAKILKLNDKIGNVISLYFAPNYIEIVLYSVDMVKLYEERTEIWIKTKDNILNNAIKLIQRGIKASKLEILGIGIAVNGLVDSKNGISLYSPHYKWLNVELKNFIEKTLGLPTYIENDVRCMALGEKNYGIAKEVDNFIFINIGNGVGSALYLNNEIYHGANFGAGELGHIPIENSEVRCKCGKRGCLENFISDEILEEKYFELTQNSLKAREIYNKFMKEDEIINNLVNETISHLVKGFIPLINLLNPSYIIINGHINHGGEPIYKSIKNLLSKKTFGRLNDILEIHGTSLGESAVHKGCANLILSNLFK